MNVPDLFVHSGSWLPVADAVVKSTLLLAFTAVAALLMRRASAAARHCVWTLGLSAALILPALSFALPRWEMPVVTFEAPVAVSTAIEGLQTDAPLSRGRVKRGASALARSATADRRSPGGGWSAPRSIASPPQPAMEQLGTPGSDLAFSTPTATTTGSAIGKARSDPRTLALAIWLAGVVAILGRLSAGLLAVQWMSRRTARVMDAPWLPLARRLATEIGIRSNLTFLRSDRATMPMAWGILRPAVLMPADADSWPADRLRIVLLHELAHVRRRDCLTHVVSQIACAVYWFNPLVWIAARHARADRERACDDLVLAAGTRGSDYADQLLELARARRDGRFPVLLTGATLAMAHRTQLEGRLIAILDPAVPRSRLSRAATAGATAITACAVLPLATLQPWAHAEAASATEAVQTYELVESVREPATPAPRAVVQRAPAPADREAALPIESLAAAIAGAAIDSVAQGHADGVIEGAVHGALRGALDGAIGALAAQSAQESTVAKERMADPRTVAALTAALKDADVEVREMAMHALVQLRDPSIYEPLVAALHDSSADIRELAAMALSQLKDPRAAEPLTAALKDQSASVREQVIFALGQLEDKATAAAIAQALSDESASVREQAAFALGQLRDSAYLDALAAALKDSSASVREQAAFALSQLRDRRATEALAAAMSDTAESVREQAVFALGQLGDPAAVDSLVKALRDAKPDVREQAAFALGQIGESRAVTALISALKDADADVRSQAAFALGQLGDRAAVEPLIIATKDASADVRSQAAFALGQLRDPRAIDALTAALKDASAEVRRQAAFALGQLGR